MSKRLMYFTNLRNWYVKVFRKGEVFDEHGNFTQAAQKVLADLMLFCRLGQSCVVFDKQGRVDPVATAVLEGRREVGMRIMQRLSITDEQLMSLYGTRLDDDDTDDD